MKARINPISKILHSREKCTIVHACAGSGKTRLIEKKINEILMKEPTAAIRVLSFNTKSVEDDKSRIDKTMSNIVFSDLYSKAPPHNTPLNQSTIKNSYTSPDYRSQGALYQANKPFLSAR